MFDETATVPPVPDEAPVKPKTKVSPELEPILNAGEDPFWIAEWSGMERIACGFCAWDSVEPNREEDFWDHLRMRHLFGDKDGLKLLGQKIEQPFKRTFTEHGVRIPASVTSE